MQLVHHLGATYRLGPLSAKSKDARSVREQVHALTQMQGVCVNRCMPSPRTTTNGRLGTSMPSARHSTSLRMSGPG